MGERREHTDLRGSIRVYGRTKISRGSPFLLSSGSSSRISIEIESTSVKSWFCPRSSSIVKLENYEFDEYFIQINDSNTLWHVHFWCVYLFTIVWEIHTKFKINCIIWKRLMHNANRFLSKIKLSKRINCSIKISHRYTLISFKDYSSFNSHLKLKYILDIFFFYNS